MCIYVYIYIYEHIYMTIVSTDQCGRAPKRARFASLTAATLTPWDAGSIFNTYGERLFQIYGILGDSRLFGSLNSERYNLNPNSKALYICFLLGTSSGTKMRPQR